MSSFTIQNILLCGAATNNGRFEFTSDRLVWNSSTSDKHITLPCNSIKEVQWYDVGRSHQLWVTVDDKPSGGGKNSSSSSSSSSSSKGSTTATVHRFEGFRTGDYERIQTHIQTHTPTRLVKKELSANGRNFGTVKIHHSSLEILDNESKLVAPIPLSSIAMVAMPSKSEIEIQCVDDDTLEREDESLLEIRFYVPPSATFEGMNTNTSSRSKSKSNTGDDNGEDMDQDEGDQFAPVSQLHALITNAAGVQNVTGEALAEIPEEYGSFLVPRGRFAIEYYPTLIRLVGASYDFKVQYKSISRVTYLPLPNTASGTTWEDAKRYALVITLDDPLRAGTQRHPHLVLQLDNEKEITVNLNIPEEDRKAGKYEGLGQYGEPSLKGKIPKVVAQLLKKISSKPVFKPETFESANRQRGVRCTHKSQDGYLFLLDKSCMWIHKPTVWIRYSDIEAAEVQRFDGTGTASARTWDLVVKCRATGGTDAREYTFQSLDRLEKEPLVKFLKDKGVNVIEHETKRGKAVNYAEIEGDDDDDEEALGNDDDDESDDDDFNSDAGSGSSDGSGSDDSDDDGEDGSDSDEGFKKRTKSKTKKSKTSSKKKSKKSSSKKGDKKKGSKGKKRKGSDSDDDDDDDDDSD